MALLLQQAIICIHFLKYGKLLSRIIAKGVTLLSEKVGIVDIGSNTIRLVIYEKEPGHNSYTEIENMKVMARLRSYFDESEALSSEGIRLLIHTLQDFVAILQAYQVSEFTCVATASIRLARNHQDIIKQVHKETGITLVLLSDYEEAYYGFVAVTHSMNMDHAMTIDIGGGSTEITYYQDKKILHYHSFPFGSLSLKLQFVKKETATEAETKKIAQFIRTQFTSLPWLANTKVPIIAIGGSARNIGKAHQHIIQYPLEEIHQYEMTPSDLQTVKEKITSLPITELHKIDGIDKERADTIHGPLEALETLCDIVQAPRLIISSKGLRDGILYERRMQSLQQFVPMREASIQELKNHFYIGNQNAQHLLHLALSFLQQLQQLEALHIPFTEEDEAILREAACLFNFGKKPDAETSSMTFFLISQRTLVGLSHKERIQLALVASYKSKPLFQQFIEPFQNWFTKEEQWKYNLLGAILKVAQSLNQSNREIVSSIQLNEFSTNQWYLDVWCTQFYRPEEYHFNQQKKHLEKLLKGTITSRFHLSEE